MCSDFDTLLEDPCHNFFGGTKYTIIKARIIFAGLKKVVDNKAYISANNSSINLSFGPCPTLWITPSASIIIIVG